LFFRSFYATRAFTSFLTSAAGRGLSTEKPMVPKKWSKRPTPSSPPGSRLEKGERSPSSFEEGFPKG
jgi:hypothetical protein